MSTAIGNERLAYPIAEAFDQLGLTRTAGYAAISAGELKTYKVGRRRYATRSACLEYAQRKERQSARAA